VAKFLLEKLLMLSKEKYKASLPFFAFAGAKLIHLYHARLYFFIHLLLYLKKKYYLCLETFIHAEQSIAKITNRIPI